MLPDKAQAVPFWEHIYRYRFATRFVRGKRVLDIACGEGYGTAALARAGAASVIGVDISEEACEHARRKYGVDARVGDARRIPLADGSLDVIVSFETIEHLDTPTVFLDECRRLLLPGGILILSTPNREAFQQAEVSNPFHCAEMTRDELAAALAPRFRRCRLYTQRPRSAPWWSAQSLTADCSPWHTCRRGYYWLRRRCALLRPGPRTVCSGVEHRYRQSPVATILARDPPFTRFINPYAVIPSSREQREQPYYFVAVAQT